MMLIRGRFARPDNALHCGGAIPWKSEGGEPGRPNLEIRRYSLWRCAVGAVLIAWSRLPLVHLPEHRSVQRRQGCLQVGHARLARAAGMGHPMDHLRCVGPLGFLE